MTEQEDVWILRLAVPLDSVATIHANEVDLNLPLGYGIQVHAITFGLAFTTWAADANHRNVMLQFGFKGAAAAIIADPDLYAEVTLGPQKPSEYMLLGKPRIVINTTPWIAGQLTNGAVGDAVEGVVILHGRAIKLTQTQVLEALQQLQ